MREKISPEDLVAGESIAESLFDEAGKMVVGAGTVLSEDRINKLQRRYYRGLYRESDETGEAATDTPAPSASATEVVTQTETAVLDADSDTPDEVRPESDGNTVGVASLRVGMKLSDSIFGPDGVLLLVAGSEITSRFLNLLRRRDIQFVRLGGEKSSAEGSENLDDSLVRELEGQDEFSLQKKADRATIPLKDLYVEAKQGLESYIKTTAVLQDTFSKTMSGRTVSSKEIDGVMSDFVHSMTLDCDLLVTITCMKETLGEYLFDHCMNVALLSMTTATYLGIKREQVVQIGMGAILQDVGMLRVPEDIRLAPRELTPEETKEVQRHPTYTIDQLDRMDGLAPVVRLIGYQVHERTDGSGYPRSRSGMTVHPFAKIVSVADTYAAMTRPRPYRDPITPHLAMKQILVEGSHQRFDRKVVRAFADIMSIFPIGSSVELSDGTVGNVVRANPGAHTRPVVAVMDADGNPADQQIDLLKEQSINVAKAL